MFKFVDSNQSYPVTIDIDVPAGGEPITVSATFRFLLLPGKEIATLLESKSDVDLIGAIVTGWSDIEDSEGNELTFSQDSLKTLSGYTYIARSIIDAYLIWARGLPVKNSKPLPSAGLAAAQTS